MKSYVTWLVLVLTVCFLSACAPVQSRPPVENVKVVVIDIPEALLAACEVTPPPAKDSYLASTQEARLELLRIFSINLLTDLKSCNGQLKKIQDLQTKQRLIHLPSK